MQPDNAWAGTRSRSAEMTVVIGSHPTMLAAMGSRHLGAAVLIAGLTACAGSSGSGEALVDEWHDFSMWHQCPGMVRDGYNFEIENADGMKLWTPCTASVEIPAEWRSPPRRFRLHLMVPGKPSTPIPLPVDQQ